MGDAFLRALSAELEQTQRALFPRCLFCVPQPRALLVDDAITPYVLYTHFLAPADIDSESKRPLGVYDTLNGKQATVLGSHIHTGKGFRDRRRVRILLSEKSIICHQEVTMLHISRPLEGGLEVPNDPSEVDVATLRKYTAIMRSFPENELVFHQLDATIRHMHKHCVDTKVFDQQEQMVPTKLREEWETAVDELLRAGTLEDLGNDSKVQRRREEDASHFLLIQQVVECYVMENLHDVIFPKVAASCRDQDAKLQQVMHRLRHYTPEDFGLKKAFQCFTADARDTLLTVTQKKTPLDMLLVLKACIDQLTDAVTQNVKLRELNFDANQLTTDDILDQLLVVLVQTFNKGQQKILETANGSTSPFCIAAVIHYISEYHFINSNTTALGFAMANFQVAIEYLLMRADHKDDCRECTNTAVKTGLGCSLTIKESNCMRAAHKLRRDLIHTVKNVERARGQSNDERDRVSSDSTKTECSDFDQYDLMIQRISIIGDWSTQAEENDVEVRAETDALSPRTLTVHQIGSTSGGDVVCKTSVAQLAGGQRFFAMVTEDGRLFTWGDSSGGRLGYALAAGDSRRVTVPRRVVALQQRSIVQVACGAFHALVTDINGHVFAWGSNSRGQLGILSSTTSSNVVKLPFALDDLRGLYINSVACGEYHSLALSADGRVYSWGCNKYGKLGRAAHGLIQMAQPREIHTNWTAWALSMKSRRRWKESCGVRRIAAGKDHSLAVSNDGAGFTWGRGDSGQLGHGCYMDVGEPKQVRAIMVARVEKGGMIDIAGGNDFSLFLLQNGTVYISGRDPSVTTEKLYLSPTLLTLPLALEIECFGRVTTISCGEAHYALLSKGGSLLVSGPKYSQPSPLAGSTTSEVQERHVVWLKEAGSVRRMVCGASHTLIVV